MTDPLADLNRAMQLLADLPHQPRREIRCGYAIVQWMKTLPKAPADQPFGGPLGNFAGVPVVLDQDLGRGTWVYLEDGEEKERHKVGDGDRVWFAGGRFITTDDPNGAEALDLMMARQARTDLG